MRFSRLVVADSLGPRFNSKPSKGKTKRRLAAILEGDPVAIIRTNLRLQAGIKQDSVKR